MNTAQTSEYGNPVKRIPGTRSFDLGKISRVASAGVSGGVGKSIDRATRMTVGSGISKIAERRAEQFRHRRSRRTPAQMRVEKQEESKPEEKKLAGVGFWLVLSTAIFKDVLDIFTNLSVVLSVTVWITTMLIMFIVNFYLFYKGVKPTAKKVGWQVITFAADAIPLISAFVGYTIYLIIVRVIENNELSGVTDKFKKFSPKSS